MLILYTVTHIDSETFRNTGFERMCHKFIGFTINNILYLKYVSCDLVTAPLVIIFLDTMLSALAESLRFKSAHFSDND